MCLSLELLARTSLRRPAIPVYITLVVKKKKKDIEFLWLFLEFCVNIDCFVNCFVDCLNVGDHFPLCISNYFVKLKLMSLKKKIYVP